ncbi:MAG: phytanoyl-CoA dioxygenase family protein [Planctomycetota bacterium]|nr:phytanoyl-CoA dioxygenase family protein [Planctomycetota bacterium]
MKPRATNTLAAPRPLSQDQAAFFLREGYLVVEDLFDMPALDAVIGEISGEIDRKARELYAAGKLAHLHEYLDFEHRLTQLNAQTPEVYQSILAGRLAGPALFNLIRHPALLDVAEQLCGPELIASSVYRLRPKMPGHPWGAVPWHQDSGYFEPFCDRGLIVTVWIPLVDATPERGCLHVLPRLHRDPILRHVTDKINVYLEIPEAELPKGVKPVCVPVRKGGALLLTNLTPHASFDNTTDVIRWSMDLRYQSAELPTNARISRLPGESVPAPDGAQGDAPADATNRPPVACYPPEADFLVRSRARPEQILKDAEAFRQLRQEHAFSPVTDRWNGKFFVS